MSIRSPNNTSVGNESVKNAVKLLLLLVQMRWMGFVFGKFVFPILLERNSGEDEADTYE